MLMFFMFMLSILFCFLFQFTDSKIINFLSLNFAENSTITGVFLSCCLCCADEKVNFGKNFLKQFVSSYVFNLCILAQELINKMSEI